VWYLLTPFLSFSPTALTAHVKLSLVRVACVGCHGNKCPLLTSFFSLSSARLLFSPKRLSKDFEILHGGLSRKKIRFGVKTNLGEPPAPVCLFIVFVFLNEKKIGQKICQFLLTPSQTIVTKISAGVDGGLSGGRIKRKF
jgi:hypothetical protein